MIFFCKTDPYLSSVYTSQCKRFPPLLLLFPQGLHASYLQGQCYPKTVFSFFISILIVYLFFRLHSPFSSLVDSPFWQFEKKIILRNLEELPNLFTGQDCLLKCCIFKSPISLLSDFNCPQF